MGKRIRRMDTKQIETILKQYGPKQLRGYRQCVLIYPIFGREFQAHSLKLAETVG